MVISGVTSLAAIVAGLAGEENHFNLSLCEICPTWHWVARQKKRRPA
jgi:hypothetical protein